MSRLKWIVACNAAKNQLPIDNLRPDFLVVLGVSGVICPIDGDLLKVLEVVVLVQLTVIDGKLKLLDIALVHWRKDVGHCRKSLSRMATDCKAVLVIGHTIQHISLIGLRQMSTKMAG